MKKVLSCFDKAVNLIIFLCIAGFVSVAFLQVIFRFVLNNSLAWSEELCRYLFVWMVFLGAGVGILKRGHIAVDVVPNLMPKAVKKYYQVLMDVLVLVFSVLLLRYGFAFAGNSFSQRSPAMQIPLGYIYSGIVIGAGVMIINSIRAIAMAWKGECRQEEQASLDISREEFNQLLGLDKEGEK